MKPFIHAKCSAKKYGGMAADYMDIHDFMDSTKAAMADVRHRAVLHSAFGAFIVEKVFGTTRINSDNREYSVRDVAEDHIMEDLGTIPSMEKWFSRMPIEDWMMGRSLRKRKEFISARNPIDTRVKDAAQGNSLEDTVLNGSRPKLPNFLD